MKKEQKPVEEVKEKERKVKKQKIEEPEPVMHCICDALLVILTC